MANLQEQLAILRGYNNAVAKRDPKLAEEARDKRFETEEESNLSPQDIAHQVQEESIVMRRERPVLSIKENVTELIFIDEVDSEIWGGRLKVAKPNLDLAIPGVGRIEIQGGELAWVGTGWLVAENIIVTNRHVAREFAARRGNGFDFRMGVTGKMSAEIDFLEEIGSSKQLVFKISRPLHIEDASGPDVAFFEVEMVSGNDKLAKPIALATTIPDRFPDDVYVATIGYPAYDSRIPERDLMETIYGKVYNKKRLAPGGITRVDQTRLWHNCTTLGGNSGSVVYDLNNGKAVGLHFSGRFLVTNYAVRADVVSKLLNDVRAGRTPRRIEKPSPAQGAMSPGGTGGLPPNRPLRASVGGGGTATLTIPLTVTVSIGTDSVGVPARNRVRIMPTGSAIADEVEFIAEDEAVAEDYLDRGGYFPEFLGERFTVDMPEVTREADDVLDFENDGEQETVLNYEHFSVVMSRSRRMCFLSACNINGKDSRRTVRGAWRLDPRIPKTQQIIKECYGNPPKFSRGHMTRREDPAWGNPTMAKRGSDDSMHVTNTTPQMQAFNSPIWLALEDYALQNAREDDMKISVFTGPYFSDDDPTMYGVRIPVAFWKVIAFIHDETGKLCATGYEMNQEENLPEEEFVFGSFTSQQLGTAAQVSIRSIEARSGIDFGKLASVDPLAGEEEGFDGGAGTRLLSLEQIRFVR